MIHKMIGSGIFSLVIVETVEDVFRPYGLTTCDIKPKRWRREILPNPHQIIIWGGCTPKYQNLLYCPETLSDKQSHSVLVAAFELPSAWDRQRHADIRFSNARFPTKVKHTAEVSPKICGSEVCVTIAGIALFNIRPVFFSNVSYTTWKLECN